MNDLTGMKIDGRTDNLNNRWTGNGDAKKQHDKWREHFQAWEVEFPNELRPRYTAYKRLGERGWKFSSRHGWRKASEHADCKSAVSFTC